MNKKHQKTLQAVFANPVNGGLEWRKIEALFIALGAEKFETKSGGVSFYLNGAEADFHRPHPHKEALRYRVKDARNFLTDAGVTP